MKHLICDRCGYRCYNWAVISCPMCGCLMYVEIEDAA